jgi:microcin C transport system permease protein
MRGYLLRRLALVPPTLLGILLLNFALTQLAPGGPVEQMLAEMAGTAENPLSRIAGAAIEPRADTQRVDRPLDAAQVERLRAQFGFDRPAHERFLSMLGGYLRFDLGRSLFRGRPVLDLLLERLPVSAALGLWGAALTYLVAVPLGIRKAVRHGAPFDRTTTLLVLIAHSVPGVLLASLLIVGLAGGRFLDAFPLQGLSSEAAAGWSWGRRVLDHAHHMVLPSIVMAAGGIAGLTMLTKTVFLAEIGKPYVLSARARGAREGRVLYGHVFRNAMLIVIAGLPEVLVGSLFTGALLVEVVFTLDGLGLLGFEAANQRDYPVVFGTLFLLTCIGLLLNLLGDLAYVLVDPRIDFDRA